MATVDDKKIIFSMVGVSKTIRQTNKQVLKNIYLSFFYGAKIGIIGLNGSGKSTLMKIIAGLDKDFQGEVVFSPGYSVGYLPQEPQLDPSKTVKEVVMEGVQPIVDALTEYEEINQKFGLPEYYEDEDKMNALFARQGELQDIIDATDAWNLDSKLERAMDALSTGRPVGGKPFGRRTPTRGTLSPLVAETGRVVARRADQPFGCRKHRLAGAAFKPIRRHGNCRDARPLFLGRRGRMDSGT